MHVCMNLISMVLAWCVKHVVPHSTPWWEMLVCCTLCATADFYVSRSSLNITSSLCWRVFLYNNACLQHQDCGRTPTKRAIHDNQDSCTVVSKVFQQLNPICDAKMMLLIRLRDLHGQNFAKVGLTILTHHHLKKKLSEAYLACTNVSSGEGIITAVQFLELQISDHFRKCLCRVSRDSTTLVIRSDWCWCKLFGGTIYLPCINAVPTKYICYYVSWIRRMIASTN